MAELDAFRDEIQTMWSRGSTQAEIIRALQDNHGRTVSRSTMSDYIRTLAPDGQAARANGGTAAAVSDEVLAGAVVKATLAQTVETVAQVVEGIRQIKAEADERHKALLGALGALRGNEALERHTRAVEGLQGAFTSALLWKIWGRALAITGIFWLAVLVGAVILLRAG